MRAHHREATARHRHGGSRRHPSAAPLHRFLVAEREAFAPTTVLTFRRSGAGQLAPSTTTTSRSAASFAKTSAVWYSGEL
jgi:hypothetical protein